jgi:hypothetical protein
MNHTTLDIDFDYQTLYEKFVSANIVDTLQLMTVAQQYIQDTGFYFQLDAFDVLTKMERLGLIEFTKCQKTGLVMLEKECRIK